jgi:hypothetical protein
MYLVSNFVQTKPSVLYELAVLIAVVSSLAFSLMIAFLFQSEQNQ